MVVPGHEYIIHASDIEYFKKKGGVIWCTVWDSPQGRWFGRLFNGDRDRPPLSTHPTNKPLYRIVIRWKTNGNKNHVT